uniref:Uncharacterized protein n=1 Tax=Melopsittacus undulatus TaxID=13146 RepID=A0A8V5HJ60_MELUD
MDTVQTQGLVPPSPHTRVRTRPPAWVDTKLQWMKLGSHRTHCSPTDVPEPLCSAPLRLCPHRCSASTAKSLLFRFLPVLRWLPRYPLKDWLLGDITSGFSVGIMHLPQGLAYALLAGLPPVTGLYSSFYPVFLYFFFGTSRHNSVGPFAVISVMIGSLTDSLLPSEDFLESINGSNMTVNEERRDAARVELVATITVLTGIFQVALGLLQFGFVVTYLSDPLVRGYTTAASVHVLISQLKNVFGVSLGEHSGPLSLFPIPCCLNHKFASKLPMPIPIELITIIISTGISYGVNLNAKFGISVVGDIPSGLKPPVVPNVSYFGQVVGNAFAIAVVGYAICISLGKIFALKHGYKVDSNQELIALGLSNFLGGFFQCFAISCSMSRSLVQESTGGNSQVAGVIASLVILVTILKIGELFRDLPKAILSAIIIINLHGMFKQFKDIRMLWKSNRVDLTVWIVTFMATLMLNLDIGLGASVAFGLLTVIFRTQLPHYSMLGRIPDTDVYRDVAQYQMAQEVPGVKIFHSSSTLYFANVELYAEALKKKSGINVDRLIEKKKKALKKLKKQQKKAEKEMAKRKKVLPCRSDPATHMQDGHNGPAVAVIELSGEEDSAPPAPTLRTLGLPQPSFHTVILDFSPVSFVDTVSIKILKNVRERQGELGGAGAPGRASPWRRGGGPDDCRPSPLPWWNVSCRLQIFRDFHEIEVDVLHCFFPSVHAAAEHARREQRSAPVSASTHRPHPRPRDGWGPPREPRVPQQPDLSTRM